MLEESDIKKLSEMLATKAEHNELKEVTNRIAEMASKHDMQLDRLQENVEHIRHTVDSLVTTFDKMAKNIEDLRYEYIAIKLQLDRHEKWIKEIAAKTGVVLSAP